MMNQRTHVISTAQLFVCLAFTIYGVAIGVYAFAALSGGETVVPSELMALIQHEYPEDTIVQARDIDLTNCEEPKSHPGLVEGDFTGDGRTDYAVVLKSNKEKKIEYRGKTYDAVEVKFVIFLSKQGGKFQKAYVEKFDQNPGPQIIGVVPVPPGVVQESQVLGGKKITLRHQGILKYHCGKSAAVYYWNKKTKRFRSIGVIE